MRDNDVSVESVELALLSDIEISSATMIKDAYLPDSAEKTDEKRGTPSPADRSPKVDGSDGPNALVSITKISNQTPPEEIEKILKKDPYRKTDTSTHDFYTLVITINMRLSDPKTTRFINGTVDLAFPRGIKILTYFPKEKGTITKIIEKGGDAITLSPSLDWRAPVTQGTKIQHDPDEKRFGIPVGPGEKITGTYRKKSGYCIDIPAGVLLEYRGMLKNDHEMFWEIYPPMPGQDIEVTGKETLAVFSFIVRAPKNALPKITANIEGRVKGNLWGLIVTKGSVVF